MRNKILLSLLIVLCLTGIFFLGKGITGLVVSESCCFETEAGANCAQENKCVIESPQEISIYQSQANVYLGITFILFSALVYLLLHRGHSKYNKRARN